MFPRLEVVRRVKKDGATYFGPYTMVKEVRETIRLIYKIFPLRQSSDQLDGTAPRDDRSRTGQAIRQHHRNIGPGPQLRFQDAKAPFQRHATRTVALSGVVPGGRRR